MTLFGYVLALCVLLGSLVLLATLSYGILRLKRRRQTSAPKRQAS